MEIRDSSKKQSTETDDHWVEMLFPPHFTFQDLLEGKSDRTEGPTTSPVKLLASSGPSACTESRRQIYVNVLREVQEKEERRRRSNLAKRISSDDHSRVDVEKKDWYEILNPDYSRKINREEECIWNEEDISKLRAALSELEKDRWRLRERLKSSEERLIFEQEESRRLEELLKESQKQMDCCRKEAARHALTIKSLKMEVKKKDIQSERFAQQNQEKAEEVDGLRAELRRTRDECQQIKQQNSDLAWQLEKVKEEQKLEMVRQVEETRLEHQVVTLRLQKELEEAHAELRAEKENHDQSLKALELLRCHFNSQGL